MTSDLSNLIHDAARRSAQSHIESTAAAKIRKLPWIHISDALPKNDFDLPMRNRRQYLVRTQPMNRLHVATFGFEGRDYWIDTSGLLLTPRLWVQGHTMVSAPSLQKR